MKLSSIRESVWPLLEPINPELPHKISTEDINLTKDENIKMAYDWAIKYYENEEKRSSSIDGKLTIFIGTVGFLITILLTITKDLKVVLEFQALVNVVAFSVIIIYLCRVVWFAIKGLQAGTYHTIGSSDFISGDVNYQKQLIVKLVNYTNKNSNVVNRKVDYMTMAQAYFKRAICSIGLYAVFIILYYIAKSGLISNLYNGINNIGIFESNGSYDGGSILEGQLASYLQSLASGLLIFASIIGAYLSVHYGNIYNALTKAYFKLINLQKEILDTDGSRESIIKNARLVEDIISNYAYNFIAINNSLSRRMKKAAKYILLLAIFIWFMSLFFIIKQDIINNSLWVLFTNNDIYGAFFCFILTLVAAMFCWSYLFKNKHMFDEFPSIGEQLDISKKFRYV